VAIPPAQQGRLSSGAFVSAALHLGGEDEGVIVPQRAVVTDAEHDCVFVSDGKTMTRREVTLSTRLTEGVIVRSGVKAGEQVVVGLLKAPKTGTPLPAYLASAK
jgi:multidrug efflux pump subunit AcrA (membrane-fusion protein)